MAQVKEIMKARTGGKTPLAYVRTYGCQQNVADGEKIKGLLAEMGFSFTDGPEDADFILFNTCAVREHAEDRVFGNVGALKNIKRRRPSVIIAVCGCMTEQEHVAERLKKSYPFVNIVFGTHVIHRLPEMLCTNLTQSQRVFLRGCEGEEVLEGIPIRRDGNSRAWVTVMYGCDNFCSYCIVPYVRGREKSREPQHILEEFRELVAAGYKEITLLGQNVNYAALDCKADINFAGLLRQLDAVDGDYRIRFMTSHPKDASKELFDVIANSRHIPHFIHLPFQSGNDRGVKGDEPALHQGAVPGADPLRQKRDARRVLHLRRDRGLPRGDLRGIPGHPVPHPGGGVCQPVHLHLLPPGRAPGPRKCPTLSPTRRRRNGSLSS